MDTKKQMDYVHRDVTAALQDKVQQDAINHSFFCDDVESAKYGLKLSDFVEAVANAVYAHATAEHSTPLGSISIGEIGEASNHRGPAVVDFKLQLAYLSERF